MKAIERLSERSRRIYRLLCPSDCEEDGRRPAGRAVGFAEAPRAGLPPYGLPSLTRNDPSPRRRQLLSRSEAPGYRVGPEPLNASESYGLVDIERTRKLRGAIAKWANRLSLRTKGPRRSRSRSDRHCIRGTNHVRFGSQASGEGPTPLSNGLSLVLVRPSTINPQGVRYASVRPLRLRLRGDRSRP